jgi:iron complex outermembrane receptor protein
MKLFYVAIALCFKTGLVFSQVSKDSLGNIELPEAIIKTAKYGLLDERNKSRISNADIKKQNAAQDLPYLLNGISSVVVTSDAGTGTGYSGIRIRGADLTRINVTLNGVPMNDAESQTTYFVNTPDILSSSSEIQISKGVGNSKNGVGSFGASIAINNLDIHQNDPSFSFQSDFGSFNTFKNVVKASTGLLNGKFVSSVRLSSIQSDGYIQRSSSNLNALQITSKYLLNPNTQLVFNYMNGKEKTGQAWNGVAQDSLATNRTYNELGQKGDGSFYNNQTDNYGQQYYQLFFDHKVNSKWSIGSTLFYTKGKGYYEEYKTGQTFAEYNLPNLVQGNDTIFETELIRQLWLDNDFYGGRVYANYFSNKLDAGLYLNYNQYDGKHFGEVIWSQYTINNQYRWYDLKASKKELNAYGMLDYRVSKKLTLFGDVQVRQVDYDINGFRKNPTVIQNLNFLFFNPKVKLTYKNDKEIYSLILGIAQKEPNRDDFEAGVSSLPKPEKLFNAELNYSRVFKKQFAIYATLFYMKYKDQLVQTGKINDVGAYTRSNVPESYRAGIELEVNWKPKTPYFDVKGNIAFSQNKIKEFTEYIDDYDQGGQLYQVHKNTDISFSPSIIASTQLSVYPLKKSRYKYIQNLSIDILQKYVGKQYLDNTSRPNKIIKSYFVNDLIVSSPIQIAKKTKLNVRAGLYNVLNEKYEANGYTFTYVYNQSIITQNYFFPQAGRRFMLGIGIEL